MSWGEWWKMWGSNSGAASGSPTIVASPTGPQQPTGGQTWINPLGPQQQYPERMWQWQQWQQQKVYKPTPVELPDEFNTWVEECRKQNRIEELLKVLCAQCLPKEE